MLASLFNKIFDRSEGALFTILGTAAYTMLLDATAAVIGAAFQGILTLGARLAESGFAPLNTPEWISHLHPQVALISVAPADWDGLPSPGTLDALEGYNLLRMDVNGWIEIVIVGGRMWVEVERK